MPTAGVYYEYEYLNYRNVGLRKVCEEISNFSIPITYQQFLLCLKQVSEVYWKRLSRQYRRWMPPRSAMTELHGRSVKFTILPRLLGPIAVITYAISFTLKFDHGWNHASRCDCSANKPISMERRYVHYGRIFLSLRSYGCGYFIIKT